MSYNHYPTQNIQESKQQHHHTPNHCSAWVIRCALVFRERSKSKSDAKDDKRGAPESTKERKHCWLLLAQHDKFSLCLTRGSAQRCFMFCLLAFFSSRQAAFLSAILTYFTCFCRSQ